MAHTSYMATADDTIRNYFAKLDLEPEIADIYMALHTHGPQTISQLSRQTKVERTRIYRLIDILKATSLITIETHYKRNIIKAAPIDNLQLVLSQREQELYELQEELRQLQQTIVPNSLHSPLTKVHFYQGAEGFKQMLWNQTRAKTEGLCILYENMQNKTNSTFFERWVRVCNERGLTFRGIIGPHFIKTQQQWYHTHTNERLANWQARFIDPKTFPITHAVITYDNIVTYYNWKDGEIFGIEIQNDEIATSQRYIFEMIWNQATPVDDIKGLQEK